MKISGLRTRLKSSRFRLPWWSRHLVGLAGVLLSVGIFLKLTREVFEDRTLQAFDEAVTAWIAAHRTPLLDHAAVDLTALGSETLVTFFTFGAVAVLLVGRDRRGAVHLLAAVVGGVLLIKGLKSFLARPRPIGHRLVEAPGFSYPSGHAVVAAVLYVTLAIVGARHFREPLYRKTLIVLAVTATILVALSRVYLGVHYATDVASGITIGAGWAVLLASVFAYGEERTARLRDGRDGPPRGSS
jgi:undecaprenyl-diphosphatase